MDGGHLLVAAGIEGLNGLMDLGGGHCANSGALLVAAGACQSGIGVDGGGGVVGSIVVSSIVVGSIVVGTVVARGRVLAESAVEVHGSENQKEIISNQRVQGRSSRVDLPQGSRLLGVGGASLTRTIGILNKVGGRGKGASISG